MPKLTKYSDHFGDWASLLAALLENEELTEFHIQPFRGRTRKAATPPIGPEAPAPETPAL